MNARALRVAKAYLNSWELPEKIIIRYVDHDEQRYNTDGDYWESDNSWVAQISKLPDWRYSFALTIHELLEMALAKAHEIDWRDITQFDITHSQFLDPGEHEGAPYHREHLDAEEIEKMVIKMFGLNWDEYEKSYDQL